MKLFKLLYKMTSWILPSKRQRISYKAICTYLDLKDKINNAQENYKKVLKRLKDTNDKIKVVFLVRENQKWSYQSLYEKLEHSDKFTPLVVVSILELARKGKDKTRNNIEETYNFFKSRGMNVDYAYKNGEYADLKEFKPDIVFYDQPWDLPEIHHPKYVSEFALTCYTSYGCDLVDCPEDYTSIFHRFMYKFFVEHELNVKRFYSYNKENIKNCVVVRYPKFEEYYEDNEKCDIWKDNDKFKIIYAPHHSLDKKGLRLSTFKQNGRFILELAQKHPETTWVFKPHPRLKYALLRTKTMTEDEIKNYFDEWARIGAVYEDGNYINLFKTSDLMITDGCTFLAEYLPSEKPLIRLVNKKGVQLNALGKKLSKGFYCTYKNSELKKLLECLVVNKEDEKQSIRKEIAKEILNYKKGETIYKYLSKMIEVE